MRSHSWLLTSSTREIPLDFPTFSTFTFKMYLNLTLYFLESILLHSILILLCNINPITDPRTLWCHKSVVGFYGRWEERSSLKNPTVTGSACASVEQVFDTVEFQSHLKQVYPHHLIGATDQSPSRDFYSPAGLSHQHKISSQTHSITNNLNNQDVEWGYPQQPFPCSFNPKKWEEVTGTLATVKVRICNSLMETMVAFAGTDPEAYVKLMNQFYILVWKMGLEATYKEAGKNVALTKSMKVTQFLCKSDAIEVGHPYDTSNETRPTTTVTTSKGTKESDNNSGVTKNDNGLSSLSSTSSMTRGGDQNSLITKIRYWTLCLPSIQTNGGSQRSWQYFLLCQHKALGFSAWGTYFLR